MLQNTQLLKIATLITYIIMVVVNAMAVLLPINGIQTAAVSDRYANLFAPAGMTFSIWSIIYLLLGAYTFFQFFSRFNAQKQQFINRENTFFMLTSIINSLWILAWHHLFIGVTVILMACLLFFLMRIADTTAKQSLSLKEKLLIKVPFGIYFGWITVATIANITTFLVSLNWNGFGIPDAVWMVIILLVGTVIISITTLKYNNSAYGVVGIWAYFGIWLKHTSPAAFNSAYPQVITTVLLCIAVFTAVNMYLLLQRKAL